MTTANLRELRTVTISQASERLNLSIELLRRWCLAGKVRYFQSGRCGTYHIVERDLLTHVKTILKGNEPADDDAIEETPLARRRRMGVLVAPASEALDAQDAAECGVDIEALLPPPRERVFSRSNW